MASLVKHVAAFANRAFEYAVYLATPPQQSAATLNNEAVLSLLVFCMAKETTDQNGNAKSTAVSSNYVARLDCSLSHNFIFELEKEVFCQWF